MIAWLFLSALLCGFIGLWHGSHTSGALMAGTALSLFWVDAGHPYSDAIWMLIDAVVVAIIVRFTRTQWDAYIVALTFAMWITYGINGQRSYDASVIIASVQLFMCWPLPALGRVIQRQPARREAVHA